MFFRRLSFIILVTLPACSGSGAEQLTKQLQPAASWLAAVDFAADSWIGNRLPTSFLEQTLQEAAQNLSQTRQAIDRIHDAPADTRTEASAVLAQSVSVLKALRGAVAISDLRASRARAEQLKNLGDTLDTLVDQLEAAK